MFHCNVLLYLFLGMGLVVGFKPTWLEEYIPDEIGSNSCCITILLYHIALDLLEHMIMKDNMYSILLLNPEAALSVLSLPVTKNAGTYSFAQN